MDQLVNGAPSITTFKMFTCYLNNLVIYTTLNHGTQKYVLYTKNRETSFRVYSCSLSLNLVTQLSSQSRVRVTNVPLIQGPGLPQINIDLTLKQNFYTRSLNISVFLCRSLLCVRKMGISRPRVVGTQVSNCKKFSFMISVNACRNTKQRQELVL